MASDPSNDLLVGKRMSFVRTSVMVTGIGIYLAASSSINFLNFGVLKLVVPTSFAAIFPSLEITNVVGMVGTLSCSERKPEG